jgi:hypothetical protein
MRISAMPLPPHSPTSSRQSTSSRRATPPPQPPAVISRSQSAQASGVVPVYQHMRNLGGIIRTIERPPNIPANNDPSIPTLGPAIDDYLDAHGYNVGSISRIEHAISIYTTPEEFINYLNSWGMAWTEAQYVWKLVQMDAAAANLA